MMQNRSPLRGVLATLAALSITAIGSGAQAAPDNLLANISEPLRMIHMFSARDGSTHIEEITLPARQDRLRDPNGLFRKYFEGAATNVSLMTFKNGHTSPYRYARPDGAENVGHIVINLQGDIVITLDEKRQYRVPPGTLMFNDDHAGQGHRTKCEHKDPAKDCLVLQMDLVDADRQMLLPAR